MSENIGNQKLINLINKAKGDRSIRKYAEDAGISASILSRTLAGTYLPGVNLLKRLTSKAAAPRGGVTFEQLMTALGYERGYTAQYARAAANMEKYIKLKLDQIDQLNQSIQHDQSLTRIGKDFVDYVLDRSSKASEDYDDYMKRHRKFVVSASGIIALELASLGIRFQRNPEAQIDGFKPDLSLSLEGQPHTSWIMVFDTPLTGSQSTNLRARGLVRPIASTCGLLPPDPARKVSLVLRDESVYDLILTYKDKLSLRTDLTLILVDDEQVIAEAVLCRYDLNADDNSILTFTDVSDMSTDI